MESPTTYEEVSLALNQFRERRLTERRSTPRASADRRGAARAQAGEAVSPAKETSVSSDESTVTGAA